MIMGFWSGNTHQRQAGMRVAWIGFVLFVIFGAFFEIVLSGFGGGLRQVVFPVALILIGLYLVIRRTGIWPEQRALNATPSTTTPPSEPPQA
jgi:hypothetical protein